MNYKKGLIIICILTSMILLVGCSQSDAEQQANEDIPVKVQVGFRAPNFTLTNLDGKEVSLSDFRGEKVVFINFWATWCPPCRLEMPHMQEIYEEMQDRVKILAVNVKEPQNKVSNFIDSNGYDFTVLSDKDGKIAADYLVRGIPKTLIVDKNGVIKAQHVGAMNKEQMKEIISKALN
ncbi:TlpA family protein disulfide reductase [Selenihalanaerobacter shriftii]|uniref:Thiol:disulfide oxidoreductases, DsbE subfamily protein n=1 Tax=Selenihalanaerobacter shriftii TaxID=142842 RepID=A0A1T4RAC0_9FIRM|nr:TlpA disulfide reductase family protein [Selenihalanaerobacter shriftii]SKA12869.1 thiol:disulfide oxidoreductases, DsbE subfamily protein [Selenihalanaerobacter shriftii]